MIILPHSYPSILPSIDLLSHCLPLIANLNKHLLLWYYIPIFNFNHHIIYTNNSIFNTQFIFTFIITTNSKINCKWFIIFWNNFISLQFSDSFCCNWKFTKYYYIFILQWADGDIISLHQQNIITITISKIYNLV